MLKLCLSHTTFPSSFVISSCHHWGKKRGGKGGTYVYISFSKSFNHFIDHRNRRAQRDKCHLTFTFKVTSCVSTFLPTVPSFTNSSVFSSCTRTSSPYHRLVNSPFLPLQTVLFPLLPPFVLPLALTPYFCRIWLFLPKVTHTRGNKSNILYSGEFNT